MDSTYLHQQIALTLLCGVGPKKARHLVDQAGSLDAVFTLKTADLQRLTGYSSRFVEQMKRAEALNTSHAIIEFLQKHRIETLFYSSASYPKQLVKCEDAPILLYTKGQIDYNQQRFVAIVGTRNATNYGKSICKELIQSFQGKNITVVSGLALGIDAYVHQYCLDFGVPTVAVLGHGLDRIYPQSHRSMAKEILRDGALVTEFPPDTLPDRENFPKRNRIVAGLCEATIVVESREQGGSLITADLANGYDRDVFAYPGSVFTTTSAGCNALIRSNGAHLIQSSKDFLDFMAWNETPSKTAVPVVTSTLNSIQLEITQHLSKSPLHIDLLAGKSNIPMASLNTELFHLQMNGVIDELPGKRYVLA